MLKLLKLKCYHGYTYPLHYLIAMPRLLHFVDGALKDELAQAQFAIDYAAEVAKLDTVDVTCLF